MKKYKFRFLSSMFFVVIMFVASTLNGQQIKPLNSGYAPVNGIKVYYEVYGEGKPLILLHGSLAAPVLIISGDNDGLDKIELMKTYKLLGGGVSGDLQSMPKSQLAIVPSQGHVSLMMQTKLLAGYLNDFLK